MISLDLCRRHDRSEDVSDGEDGRRYICDGSGSPPCCGGTSSRNVSRVACCQYCACAPGALGSLYGSGRALGALGALLALVAFYGRGSIGVTDGSLLQMDLVNPANASGGGDRGNENEIKIIYIFMRAWVSTPQI